MKSSNHQEVINIEELKNFQQERLNKLNESRTNSDQDEQQITRSIDEVRFIIIVYTFLLIDIF